jgi:hypothetical protein
MNMTTPARLVPVIESHGFMVDTTTGECIERNIDVDQRMNSCPKAPHTDLLEFQPHVIVLNGNPVCHNTNYTEERERDMWQCISRTCNALQIESKKLHQRAFFITRHVMPWQTGSMQAFVAIVIFKLLNELVYTHIIRRRRPGPEKARHVALSASHLALLPATGVVDTTSSAAAPPGIHVLSNQRDDTHRPECRVQEHLIFLSLSLSLSSY